MRTFIGKAALIPALESGFRPSRASRHAAALHIMSTYLILPFTAFHFFPVKCQSTGLLFPCMRWDHHSSSTTCRVSRSVLCLPCPPLSFLLVRRSICSYSPPILYLYLVFLYVFHIVLFVRSRIFPLLVSLLAEKPPLSIKRRNIPLCQVHI